jgi:hypothetical protein
LLAEDQIVALFAGAAAESRYLRRRVRIGMERDYHAAMDLGSYFFPSSRTLGAFLRYTESRARDLVEFKWRAISSVAHELLKHKKPNYQQVVAAIRTEPRRPSRHN